MKPPVLKDKPDDLELICRYFFGFVAGATAWLALYFTLGAFYELAERGFEPFWASGPSLEILLLGVPGIVSAALYLYFSKATRGKIGTYPKLVCVLLTFVSMAYGPLFKMGAFDTDCTALDNCNGGAILRSMSTSKHNYLKNTPYEDWTPPQYRYTLEDKPSSKTTNKKQA